MPKPDDDALRSAILSFVPADGKAIGNGALSKAVAAQAGAGFEPTAFEAARVALVADGTLIKGAGRGGSVRRAASSTPPRDLADGDDFELRPSIPPAASVKAPTPRAKAAPLPPRHRPSPAARR
ncbi:MAG: hypothetical protein IPG91_21140 [Ideonella sp.]|nr:hypothetical protein [Ideonella sp.]